MNGLLLDTHVVLWASSQPERLGPIATARLLDETTELYVSAVSAAEIAVKRSIGKLEMDVETDRLLGPLGAAELPLSIDHANATSRLELIHRDPFDRLLIAQALHEGLTLMTADHQVLQYPVALLDARR